MGWSTVELYDDVPREMRNGAVPGQIKNLRHALGARPATGISLKGRPTRPS